MDTDNRNYIDGTEELDQVFHSIDITLLRRSLKTIMKPAISVTIDTPIDEAIRLMQTKRIGCVLVTSRDKLFGIFTERDVLKKIVGASFDLKATPIAEVMTPNPHALNVDDTIAYALNYMDLGGYRHIPVVNQHFEPVGVVSVKDIVSYVVERFADEILNLPPHPFTMPIGVPDWDSKAGEEDPSA
jgi:CBS domain-containing protein